MEGDLKNLFDKIQRLKIVASKLADGFAAGAYKSAFKGKGVEFEEAREFQEGDDYRSIDWNVTARLGTPYVKLYKEERDLPVFLLADISSSMFTGSQALKKDTLLDAAALISFAALKNNDRVGLIAFADEIEYFLPPGKGTRHTLRLLRDLYLMEPKTKKTDVKKALSFLSKVYKKRAICFLLSDFHFPVPMKELAPIAIMHDFTAVILSDPLEKTILDAGLITFKDPESQKDVLIDTSNRNRIKAYEEQVEKDLKEWKRALGRSSASWVEIDTRTPVEKPMRQFFEKRKIRH